MRETHKTHPHRTASHINSLQTGNGDKKIIIKIILHIFLSMNLDNSLKIKQRWEAEMNMVISHLEGGMH